MEKVPTKFQLLIFNSLDFISQNKLHHWYTSYIHWIVEQDLVIYHDPAATQIVVNSYFMPTPRVYMNLPINTNLFDCMFFIMQYQDIKIHDIY